MKRDKIFDNNHGNYEYTGGKIDFNLDASVSTDNIHDDVVDLKIIYREIDVLVKNSKFNEYNIPDEKGSFKKLNKVDINEVYSFITSKLEHPKIETFSTISDYFDINFNKFYESLSNKFKEELLTELESRGSFKDYFIKNLGGKLF